MKKAKAHEGTQLALGIPAPRCGHGGRRPGAGRPKETNRRVGVPHRSRPFHDRDEPVHVTWRVVPGLPSLRTFRVARAIGLTFRESTASHRRRKTGFRVIHFSIQGNHLHLIVEALGRLGLRRGLRGLGVWLSRRINRALGREGQVLADRYHARPLTSPREVRNGIVYVLQNHRHHEPSAYLVDEKSSGLWFDGWERRLAAPATTPPVAAPRTWLARLGWRRHGLIRFTEMPAS